ncbi:MAG: aminotransferase class V-fold PLP-dependent enzyme, partial [Bacteroidota bacterium]
LKGLGLSLVASPFVSLGQHREMPLTLDPLDEGKPQNEAFWKKFARKHYDISSDFINLENGYFGVQPRTVMDAYQANIQKVNTLSSKYMRQEFYQTDFPQIMESLAQIAGTATDELLVTRNATEALNILIQGIDWQKGDEVILQHHDYHSMIETFQMLEKQKGIVVKFLEVPLLPQNPQEIVNLYTQAVTPRTRGILLTHLTHLTGQIMPVKAISDFARAREIEVIVDAAHSFAQLDYQLPDLGADFVGVNLHKWFGNPLGAGLMYIKKERIPDIQPLFGDVRKKEQDIRKLGHYGTPATPIVMTLRAAATFHQMVGIQHKEARLRYLQNYWTEKARKIARVQITTPVEATQSCALASFRIDGVEAQEVVRRLDQEFGVFTVIRRLHQQDDVVRVTPNLYNGVGDLDRLLEGIEGICS